MITAPDCSYTAVSISVFAKSKSTGRNKHNLLFRIPASAYDGDEALGGGWIRGMEY